MKDFSSKLVRCPFCGGNPKLVQSKSKKYFVIQCPEQSKCRDVIGVMIPAERIEEGIDAWNSRSNFGYDEIQIVTSLSLGVNPISGLEIPQSKGAGVYKKRKAYLAALNAAAKIEVVKNLSHEKFSVAGLPSLSRRWADWSVEEDDFLISLWKSDGGVPLHKIAHSCGRSVGAIESRLIAIGAESSLNELRSKNRLKLRKLVELAEK